jgi:hypothetical protein
MKAVWVDWRGLVVGALLVAFAGCDNGNPRTYPVIGTVTYRGNRSPSPK